MAGTRRGAARGSAAGGEAAQPTTALVATAQRSVTLIEGDEVLALRSADGAVYLPLRPICANVGLEYTAQVRRIRRDAALAEGLALVEVQTVGGVQPMQCLLLDNVPYWLSTVDLGRVKPELHDRLLAYKRWVIQRVWEAFARETGIERAPAPPAPPAAPDIPLSLEQIEQMGLAIATLARQQRQYEGHLDAVAGHVEHLDGEVVALRDRMDRAAEVVGGMLRTMRVLKERMLPGNPISPEQAAEVSALVKAIATEITRRQEPGEGRRTNAYGAIFGELYRRFGVPSYKEITVEQFPEVMAWLSDYHGAFDAPE